MVDTDYKKMDEAYRKAIAKYLDQRARKDEYLAAALEKPGKTLDGVVSYIRGQAKKQQKNGVAIIPDEEVYEWAVHYILEDSLECESKEKEEKLTSESETKKAPAPERRKKKTIAQEVSEQLLLDF